MHAKINACCFCSLFYICSKFEPLTSRGSAATYLRCDGDSYMVHGVCCKCCTLSVDERILKIG